MTPDFDREAGRVLASPYFTQSPPDLDGDALVDWYEQRDAEKDTLFKAVEAADGYDDLAAEAKDIYDRAAEAIEHAVNAADNAERMSY